MLRLDLGEGGGVRHLELVQGGERAEREDGGHARLDVLAEDLRRRWLRNSTVRRRADVALRYREELVVGPVQRVCAVVVGLG